MHLVQAVAPAAAGHGAPGELIHNDDLQAGRQWQAVAGNGRQWQAVAGSGRQWQAVAGGIRKGESQPRQGRWQLAAEEGDGLAYQP